MSYNDGAAIATTPLKFISFRGSVDRRRMAAVARASEYIDRHPSPFSGLWQAEYIYIYAFSRRFYPKRLTVHSGYTFFCQYVCSLGIEPTTFALLTQ